MSWPVYFAAYANATPVPTDEPAPKKTNKKEVKGLPLMGVSMTNLNTVHWLRGGTSDARGVMSCALPVAGEGWRVSCSSGCARFTCRDIGIGQPKRVTLQVLGKMTAKYERNSSPSQRSLNKTVNGASRTRRQAELQRVGGCRIYYFIIFGSLLRDN